MNTIMTYAFAGLVALAIAWPIAESLSDNLSLLGCKMQEAQVCAQK